MFLLYFLALLVPLVLFHEFGHYLAARLMGVKVLAFAVGFGPVVWKWQRGPTEFSVRLLPLGGFVRMQGDDSMAPTDPSVAADPASFHNKPVWRRAVIVAAGPIANILLPLPILFIGALALDGQVVSARVGTVEPGLPAAEAGLQTGDRIVEIAGESVLTFDRLQQLVSERPGLPTPVVYEREGQRHTTQLTPVAHREVQVAELGLVDQVGRIGVRPTAQSSVVTVEPGSPAWMVGLRSGDRIAAVNGQETPRYYEMRAALAQALRAGKSVSLRVNSLRSRVPVVRKALAEAYDSQHQGPPHLLALPAGLDADRIGLSPADLVVGPVEKGSPADTQAGLRPGDQILSIGGAPTRSFLDVLQRLSKPYDDVRIDPESRGLSTPELVARMRAALSRPHPLLVRHVFGPEDMDGLSEVAAGRKVPANPLEKALLTARDPQAVFAAGYIDLQVPLTLGVTVDAEDRPSLSFGANPAQSYELPELIDNPAPVLNAIDKTGAEMKRALNVTVLTVAGLLRGHVPVKEVGGPIFMAQLASKTAELGAGFFFHLMVWISINLAILNLFPIPLVDGGHLLFLAIEAVKRKPVSLRTRQIAAYVGMSLLGLLFVVVMKNDVQRLIATLTQ